MPIIQVEADKLCDVEVSHISLVRRGANRIPFKIVKQEDPMSIFKSLDLGNLGSMFSQKAEANPGRIVGVITMKGDGFESIKDQIKDAGFEVEDAEEMADGSVIFKQEELVDSGVVVRMNDNIAVVTKGFSPYEMTIGRDGVSFSDLCESNGFYPGVNAITETIGTAVRQAVHAATSVSEAKKAVEGIFQEAKAYAVSFIEGLPEKAFKLESIYPVALKAEAASVDSAITEPAPALETDGVIPDVKKEEEEEASSDDADVDVETVTKTEGSLTSSEVSAIVTSAISTAVTGLASKLSGVTSGVSGVLKSVADLDARFNDLVTRIESVEAVAKDAKAAVAGTVLDGTAQVSDELVRSVEKRARKADIDTAFLPRRPFRR